MGGSTGRIDKVAVVLRPSEASRVDAILPELCSWLAERGRTAVLPFEDRDRLSKMLAPLPKTTEFMNKKEMHRRADLIVSLGGDGTLLGASRLATRDSPPVFGVNAGRLGFITAFEQKGFLAELDSVLKGAFDVARVSLYKAEVRDADGGAVARKGHFLNDAIFNKNDISRMIALHVSTGDGEPIYTIDGDGLIVSSPVGSTAYSLAAGGPVVHPGVNAMVVTPICPHGFNTRPVPIVIPETMDVVVEAGHRRAALCLTLDGQETLPLRHDQKVLISKSRTRSVKLVKNVRNTYFNTLRRKFSRETGRTPF